MSGQGLGWEDTHYRWPSPSLPPTLKKDHHKNKFGTLDRLSPEKTIAGKINYGFDSPADETHFSSTSSTNSEELVDDFGDPIKPSSKSSSSKSRTITRQSHTESEDDDGWTTEF